MSKAKLHEVLAVENTLGKAAEKLIKESNATFQKENLFMGQLRSLTMFDGEQQHLNTKEEVRLTSTVDENIDYLVGPVADYWDAVLQKDSTNQEATADIVIDGTVLAEAVPATFLLGLETKLGEIRKLYDSIHTLAPGVDWQPDTEADRPGVFKGRLPDAFKTEKEIEFRVVVEADQYHPAQVRELSKTSNVGRYETYRWCGLLTPLEKANRIRRIDKLIQAVKKARQRANNAELVDRHIGRDLFEYINGGA